MYPFVAMQLFNDDASNHNFVYDMTINRFPRIFILSKHSPSESVFLRSPLEGAGLAFHEPMRYLLWKVVIMIKKNKFNLVFYKEL